MIRFAAAAIAIVFMTTTAHAQGFSMGGGGKESQKTRYSDEEKRQEAATEKAYRDAIKNTKNSVSETYDPWRNIRPESSEKKR